MIEKSGNCFGLKISLKQQQNMRKYYFVGDFFPGGVGRKGPLVDWGMGKGGLT